MSTPRDPYWQQPQPPQSARTQPFAYPQGQHAYPPQDEYAYPMAPPTSPRRRKRRVFLWVFLAIQAIFILWLVVGIATAKTGPTHAQLVSACYHHNWWPLFKSQADCVTHYGGALNDAGQVGTAIGAGLVVLLWVVVDLILGISYGVYKLATRR